MSKIFISGLAIFSALFAIGQPPQDTKTLYESAKAYQKQGDYANAIVVLNRALVQQPNDLEMLKDLAFTYYLQRDYIKAKQTASPLVERNDADVQSFQVLGLVYKALEERKECERLYKDGLKKFPNSGILYNEYGEMLWTKQDYSAIKYWEKGIEVDPNYSGNYYNATKHYFLTFDKVWALIYGEIFINLESYSRRSAEIKNVLLDSYKKLFSDSNILQKQDMKNPFVAAYLNTMNKHIDEISTGITPETITVLRTKFILDWFDKEEAKYPFRLFEYHRQLLKEGMFEAYNQWIFGAAQNLPAYQNWINTNKTSYTQFYDFQKGRIFKLPQKQYYQTANSK